MESKANILFAHVGTDGAKVSLSYFVTDAGSVKSAEKIKEELDEVIRKHGGTPET